MPEETRIQLLTLETTNLSRVDDVAGATCYLPLSLGRNWRLQRVSLAGRQGLTLVNFSAQPEPFLTQNTP